MSSEQEEPLISEHRDDDDDFQYSAQRRSRFSRILDRVYSYFSSSGTGHEEDHENSDQFTSYLSRRSWRLFSLFAIIVLLILSFILGYQAASRSHSNQLNKSQHLVAESTANEDQRWQSCGSTPSQAVARGCSFDTLSFTWQTPECYDAELMAEWESTVRENGWKYYADKTGKRPVPYETAFTGTYELWVEWDLHVVHCTFMWRQMHRAFTLTGFIDSHLNSYNHTLHCQSVLVEDHDSWLADTAARVRYPTCERIGT